MHSSSASMALWILWGAAAGIAGAYSATRRAKNFRKKLLQEFEARMKDGTASLYAAQILSHRASWKKSASLIRKPFNKHVNIAVETAALIYAGTGMVNSLVHFETTFGSSLKGMGVIMLLSLIMAYIPAEWFFSGRIDKEMDAVLEELEAAVEAKKLEPYLAEAKSSWA